MIVSSLFPFMRVRNCFSISSAILKASLPSFCGEADVNFQMRCAKVVFNDIGFDGLIPGVAIGLCLREFRELFG